MIVLASNLSCRRAKSSAAMVLARRPRDEG
jgi:hypothetical protein